MIHAYDDSWMDFSPFTSLPISPFPPRSDFILLNTFRRLKDFTDFEIKFVSIQTAVVLLLPL